MVQLRLAGCVTRVSLARALRRRRAVLSAPCGRFVEPTYISPRRNPAAGVASGPREWPGEERIVSHYLAIAHRVGSPEARDLGRQLSSWHDRMVAHQRGTRAFGHSCHEACPHAESIEFWQAARQILGNAAEDLAFLSTTAEHAAAPGRRSEPVARHHAAGLAR